MCFFTTYYLLITKMFWIIILNSNIGSILTNQMVHYLLVKTINQMVYYFVNKKYHFSHNGHAEINLSKMMAWFF